MCSLDPRLVLRRASSAPCHERGHPQAVPLVVDEQRGGAAAQQGAGAGAEEHLPQPAARAASDSRCARRSFSTSICTFQAELPMPVAIGRVIQGVSITAMPARRAPCACAKATARRCAWRCWPTHPMRREASSASLASLPPSGRAAKRRSICAACVGGAMMQVNPWRRAPTTDAFSESDPLPAVPAPWPTPGCGMAVKPRHWLRAPDPFARSATRPCRRFPRQSAPFGGLSGTSA